MTWGLLLAALALMLGGGALLFLATAEARKGRRALASRVDQVAPAPEERRAASAARWALAEDRLKRIFGFGMKSRWGAESTGRSLLMYAMGGGVTVWALALLVLRLPAGLAALAALAGFIIAPRIVLTIEQGRAEAAFTDLFPDAIDMVIRMMRAGLPVTAAIRTVGQEAPSPVKEVFATMSDQVDIGVPLDDALAAAGDRIDLTDFRFFTVAVAMQHATGGNLAVTLETLSEIIRKRRAMRMKAKAVTAEVRMTAYVLAAIPFFVIGALLAFNPQYLSPLIEDRRGNIIAGIAIGMLVLGFLSMRQLMRRAIRF